MENWSCWWLLLEIFNYLFVCEVWSWDENKYYKKNELYMKLWNITAAILWGFFSVETTTQKTHLWNMNEQMLLSIYEVAVMVTWLPTCCVVCISTELVWYDAVVRVYSSLVGQWAECRGLYKSTSSSVKSCTSATAGLWVGRSSCERTAATKISRSAAVYARQWTQVISMVPTNHQPVPDDTAFYCAVKGI